MERDRGQQTEGGVPVTPVGAYAIARVIALALAGGVAAFWLVAWVLTGGGARPMGGGEPGGSVPLMLWAAVAVGTFAGAMVMRSRALAEADEGRPTRASAPVAPRAGAVQAALMVSWALLEAQALMAGVVFLMWGSPSILAYSGLLYALGVALTFPRAEWFGVDLRRG